MSARDEQVGGDHYKTLKVQKWDALEAWLTQEQFTGYLLGESIGYLQRFNANAPGKGGLLDVEKAHHTLQRLIEHLEDQEKSHA